MKKRPQQAQEVKQGRKKKVNPKKPYQKIIQKRKRPPPTKQIKRSQKKIRIQEMRKK